MAGGQVCCLLTDDAFGGARRSTTYEQGLLIFGISASAAFAPALTSFTIRAGGTDWHHCAAYWHDSRHFGGLSFNAVNAQSDPQQFTPQGAGDLLSPAFMILMLVLISLNWYHILAVRLYLL